MATIILDVDTDWLQDEAEKLASAGAYTLGLVVLFEGNKLLVGTTRDGKYQCTSEYDDGTGKSRSHSTKGRTAAEAVRRCSKFMKRQRIVIV